jgi:hypothetical protein
MSRERIGTLVLRAYPPDARLARGPEMLSMLLDAGGMSSAAFARECGSLVVGGLRERAAITARRRRGRRIPLLAAVMIVAIIAVATLGTSNPISGVGSDKSNLRALAGDLAPRLRPGDLVFLAQPEQTKLAYYYLPDGLRYATPLGPDDHPGSSSQFVYGLANSDPQVVFDRLLTTLVPGQHLLFIRPITEARVASSSKWSALVRRRAAQWAALLASDPELRTVAWAPHTVAGSCCADVALLYVKS